MSKREQILQAALELARTEGLSALSVRTVAAKAGVGATTLRNYFPSQALLYQAVATEFVAVVLDDLDIADTKRAPAQRLFDCVAQFLPPPNAVEETLSGWFEYYRLTLGPDANDAVRELLMAGRRESERALGRWLRTLADEGHIAAEDIDMQVTKFLAVIDGIHLTMLAEPERVDIHTARSLLRWLAEDAVAS